MNDWIAKPTPFPKILKVYYIPARFGKPEHQNILYCERAGKFEMFKCACTMICMRSMQVRPRFGAEIRDSNLAFEFPPNSGAHFLCTFAFFERELALFRK